MHRTRGLVSAFLVWLVALAPGPLVAEVGSEDASSRSQRQPRLHLDSSVALRAVPIGLRFGNDIGARWSLFDSESRLLEETWFETGVTTELTPANGWFGGYLHAVPIAILELRASIRSLHYFGTFGFLHIPDDQSNPDWTLDAVDDDIGAGRAARGWMATLRARPRFKSGSFIAFVEGELRWVRMDLDEIYYESTFDLLLEPNDGWASVVPTAGWVFEFSGASSWLLAGAGWEHLETFDRDITRDMARLLFLWNLPGDFAGGTSELAVLAGHWVSHPNREGEFWLGGQFSVDWML